MIAIFWLISYLMKVIAEKASWARHLKINRYVFHYFHLLDTSAGGLLVPGDLIHTVVSDSVYVWYLHFLYGVLLKLRFISLRHSSLICLFICRLLSKSQRSLNYLAFISCRSYRSWYSQCVSSLIMQYLFLWSGQSFFSKLSPTLTTKCSSHMVWCNYY